MFISKCNKFVTRVWLCLQVPYFTQYMITIVNNCLQFVELAQQTKQHYWRPGTHDNDAGHKFEALLNTFQVQFSTLWPLCKQSVLSADDLMNQIYFLSLISHTILLLVSQQVLHSFCFKIYAKFFFFGAPKQLATVLWIFLFLSSNLQV